MVVNKKKRIADRKCLCLSYSIEAGKKLLDGIVKNLTKYLEEL